MIPVSEPVIGDEEVANVVDAMQKGELSGSFGHYIEEFEHKFAAYVGCKHGVAVTSGTTALHLAVAAAEIGAGDEVLISASTNIATALAVAHNNALPVAVDSEPETWNLDLGLIEGLITPRTKAIIPVHLYGHPVDMDRLMDIARRHGIIVIEDCAESHGAMCRGRQTGSFGAMGCFSFYANKVITTGEGGMVVTNDDSLAGRLRLLRNLGFTTPRFRHDILGYNFRMPGLQAAIGVAQVAKLPQIVTEKRRVAHSYNSRLQRVPGVQIPPEKDWAHSVYWMYAITIDKNFGMSRDVFSRALRERGIDSRTFFYPMNKQPCLQDLPGFRATHCPVAEELWETGLYLPSTYTLGDDVIRTICEAVADIQRSAR